MQRTKQFVRQTLGFPWLSASHENPSPLSHTGVSWERCLTQADNRGDWDTTSCNWFRSTRYAGALSRMYLFKCRINCGHTPWTWWMNRTLYPEVLLSYKVTYHQSLLLLSSASYQGNARRLHNPMFPLWLYSISNQLRWEYYSFWCRSLEGVLHSDDETCNYYAG